MATGGPSAKKLKRTIYNSSSDEDSTADGTTTDYLSDAREVVKGPNMEHPLPFITTDEDGKLHVNSNVLMPVLSGAKQSVSIVSIVGKYRTGKSYIMNRIFNQNAGFSLGETTQSKTKGIWIWARPHPLEPKRTLLLLDTEGLYDVEKGDETHDMQLFSLALLLSNCLVFNAVGAIDDAMIKQLHLVTELTERIKTKESEEEQGDNFSKYFPAFFFLLRDFFLALTVDNQPCSPDEYMENALKLKKGIGSKINAYNEPRECIRGYFPTRKCHTLCKPVDNDAKLRNLDKVQEGEIKDEFLAAAKKAIDDILKEAKPFTVDGNVINGPRFIELAGMYVDAINNNGIPCIGSAMELLKNNECQRALDGALSIFSDVMDNSLKDKMPVEEYYLSEVQKTAHTMHTAAMAHYNTNSLFDEDGKFTKTLTIELDKRYKGYNEENKNLSVKKCNELIQKYFKIIDDKINFGRYMGKGGYDMYKVDRNQAVKNYKDAAKKIPMVRQTLNIFLTARKTEENAIINTDKALSEKDKQLAEEQEERMRQEERIKAAEHEQQQLKADLRRQKEEQAKTLTKYKNDLQKRQMEMQEEHARDMETKQAEYDRLIQEGSEKQAKMHREMLNDRKEERKQRDIEFRKQREDFQAYKTSQEKLMDDMDKEKYVSKRKIEELDEQMKENEKNQCCVM